MKNLFFNNGEKFNRLTIVGLNRIENYKKYVDCICDCGNKKIVRLNLLKHGDIKSCGCMNFKGGLVKDISNFTKIPAYPDFGINKVGKIISFKYRSYLLSNRRNSKQGHISVNINGKQEYIHRLVANTFLGYNLDSSKIICHKDDNPLNNSVRNLYIGTRQSNMIDRVKNGNHKGKKRKYNNICVKNILSDINNYYGRKKDLIKMLQQKYGISATTYYKILNHKY